MSSDRISLNNLKEQVDNNLSKSNHKSNYKFFRTRNSATEKDLEVTAGYQNLIGSICSRSLNTVSSFFNKSILSSSQPKATSSNKPNQPYIQKPTLSKIPKRDTAPKLIRRCEKCKCTQTKAGPCVYCNKSPQIEVVLDSDQEPDKSVDLNKNMSTPQFTQQISPASFYSPAKENSSKLNSSKSNLTAEDGTKYEIDYLYIGTHRFISRTYVRICNDHLSLNLASKSSLNINYKLIVRLSFCEHRSDSSKFTYIKIDFVKDAVDEINKYIETLPDQNGCFKYESVNGHQKYFIMKLKFIQPDEVKNLKSRLKIFLQNRLRDDGTIYGMFEDQRQYCMTLRTRKKQKTTCNSKFKNQDKLKDSVIMNKDKNEPMEIDQHQHNVTTNRLSNYNQQQIGYMTRSARINERSSPLNGSSSPSIVERKIVSSNSINIDQDDDMEVSEITEPQNLSFKNIKNSKIIYETGLGETIVILKTDLSCLSEGNFLNDKIIEFYLMYIKSKLIDQSIAEKTYIFSSFFFTKMLSLTKGSSTEGEYNLNTYNLVKNWTKNVDIFEYDYLIVPIFKNSHWSLAIIVFPGKVIKDDFELILDDDEATYEKPAIIFMDSMGKKRIFQKYSKLLRNFLSKECETKKDLQIEFSTDQMSHLDPEVPYQLNGYDCGIFVLHYVELFLKNPTAIIPKCRAKKELESWFSSSELRGKRNQIFNILSQIHDENLKNGMKFESDEDLTLKSDEEIEIINNDDKDNALLSDDDDEVMS